VTWLPDLHRSAARLTATALVAVGIVTGAPAQAAPAAPTGHQPPVVRPVGLPIPADGIRDTQWQLGLLHAATAWRHSTGEGVTVAVLDSGVDGRHPDLNGQVLPGIDLVNGGVDGRRDPVGHGTTVASLIAGRADDGNGVVGIAPGAKILPVRVLDADNRYDDAMIIAQGVRWAVDHGARVLNLSLGGLGQSEALAEALDYAFAKDAVVIACTGNLTTGADNEVWYPAREPGVVAVTGLDQGPRESLWTSAITGPQTVLSAPATGLTGARPGGYWRVQGTSFAAPLVSATAALIRARWPQMSAANVINRLVATAHDLGPAGRDGSYGYGLVDPVAALTEVVPTVESNPLDNTPPPGLARFGPAPGIADTGPVPAALGGTPEAEHPSGVGAEHHPVESPPQHTARGLLGVALVLLIGVGGFLAIRRSLNYPPPPRV
jgi:type VII secretion-associated serine protease mycosin